tara:strand:+ start:276 stop:410 length:135 start_codon:yes stop_codon:yes gene_type:complete
MTWKVKDEHKDNTILFDINSLSEAELKKVKETIPDIIDKYFEEI